jgi:hypothetical protein
MPDVKAEADGEQDILARCRPEIERKADTCREASGLRQLRSPFIGWVAAKNRLLSISYRLDGS